MFDPLLALLDIPIVQNIYLFGAGGMFLYYTRHSGYDDKDPFPISVLFWLFFTIFGAAFWPFVIVAWVFEKISHWRFN